jgi:hypothetical protein
MLAKISAFLALTLVVFLTISAPASSVGNCGAGKGRGNDIKPSAGCPPNKHNGAGVPGPIAGVGLPFLIVGVAAYRRRRKSNSDEAE